MFNNIVTIEELTVAFCKKKDKLAKKKLTLRDFASAHQLLLTNFHARRLLILNGN